MTPKEKAIQLIDMFGNKSMALLAVHDAMKDYKSTQMFYFSKVKILPKIFWDEVKQEIEKL
jgi:hypothetical protein